MIAKQAVAEPGVVADPDQRVQGEVPDIALEVIHAVPILDKLSIYAGLGVPEVWLLRRGVFEVHVLAGGQYEQRERSALLPDLDLSLVASMVDEKNQTDAVRRFRRALRG
jgi:Uma2 family endonuclease